MLGPAFLRLLNRYVPFLHQLLGGIMLPGSNGSPYGHHNQLQLAVKVSGALAGPLKRRQGPGQASRATRSSTAWPAAAWATSTRAPPGRRRRADPPRTTRCCWAWSWRGRRSGAAMRGTCALAFGATVFKAELRERCETFHRVCPRSFDFFLQILRCSLIFIEFLASRPRNSRFLAPGSYKKLAEAFRATEGDVLWTLGDR